MDTQTKTDHNNSPEKAQCNEVLELNPGLHIPKFTVVILQRQLGFRHLFRFLISSFNHKRPEMLWFRLISHCIFFNFKNYIKTLKLNVEA